MCPHLQHLRAQLALKLKVCVYRRDFICAGSKHTLYKLGKRHRGYFRSTQQSSGCSKVTQNGIVRHCSQAFWPQGLRKVESRTPAAAQGSCGVPALGCWRTCSSWGCMAMSHRAAKGTSSAFWLLSHDPSVKWHLQMESARVCLSDVVQREKNPK